MELDHFPRWAHSNKICFNSLRCKVVHLGAGLRAEPGGWGQSWQQGPWEGLEAVKTCISSQDKQEQGNNLDGEVLRQMNPSP